MGRLIGNIVARNEAAAYLPIVLERLNTQVDEIVFTDDASTDSTVELAEQYTKNIQVLESPLFSTDEGALRQKTWDFLQEVIQPTPSDWILAIDADELLYETKAPLKTLIETKDFDVINVEFYHMWNEKQYRVDGAWHPHGSTRLFRWQPNGSFNQRKLACGSEPNFVAWTARYFGDRVLIDSGLKMQHLSYIKDEDKLKKYDRYSRIDGGAFHANSHINSIIDSIDKVSLEDWKY